MTHESKIRLALHLLSSPHPIGAIEPVKEPSWFTIAIASVATGIILWATWSGALFGGS